MNVELTGDWNRLTRALSMIRVRLKPLAIAKLYEDGELVLDMLNYHIDMQDFNWQPKVIVKSTPDLWVETGSLKDSMEVIKFKKGSENGVFIGFPKNKNHYSGLSCADLAVMLEDGDPFTGIPPRPLVRPTWVELKSDILNSWKQFIIDFVNGV